MNYVYDIVLNFFDYRNVYDFYEWEKEDNYFYIEKIPIFVINSMEMDEIMFSRIKISKELVDKIRNKTIYDKGSIDYSFLITNREKVMALKFNSSGELTEISNLLFDEEEMVIQEVNDFNIECLDYEIIGKKTSNLFLTRNDKYIRNYLLNEINNLYINKKYDEINYLYYEVFNDNCDINKKYEVLVNNISNDYNNRYNRLYDIIKLSKEKILEK